MRRNGPALCPTDRVQQISVPRAVVLPVLQVQPVEYPSFTGDDMMVTPDVYAWVDDYTPVYRHPAEANAGLPPVRVTQPGFTYVSLEGETRYEGQHWYQVNVKPSRPSTLTEEWVLDRWVHLVKPSTFVGAQLAEQPTNPFAWVLRNVQPSSVPGGPPISSYPLRTRYERVIIYGLEKVGTRTWYLVDANQWIQQTYLGIVDVSARPAAVSPDEKWIEVDLYEQTLAAYKGDQMVFATLVSSGLPQWETRRGLFRIWGKVYIAKMSGREGKPDYYHLEDVPWTMYFDGEIGLHGAYWHDGFGYRRSHGCVNLAPVAARWLWDWTDPHVPEGLDWISSTGTWVWVH
jgi:hypothetical protein